MAISLLVAIYIFQNFDYSSLLLVSDNTHPYLVFVINKFLRLTLNDSICLLIIYVLFQDKELLKVGSLIQIFEMFLLLPIYFVIKLSLEGDSEISSPLLSQVHRLIVNPLLMILFIFGVYFKSD